MIEVKIAIFSPKIGNGFLCDVARLPKLVQNGAANVCQEPPEVYLTNYSRYIGRPLVSMYCPVSSIV